MRLTTVIILLTVFQLSAAITFGQKLTYNKKNTTINQLFKEIKTQTGYNVVWYEGKLNSQMVIDAKFYNTPLEKVMDNVLAGRAVTYEIIGKAIVIKVAEPSFRDKIISFFATIDVRGRVLDENNEPLVGAVVKVKGGPASTATNSKGEFLLKNVDEKAVVVISFLGYEPQEIQATEKIGDIKLSPREDKLKEVEINAGYYTVSERERTGSISRVNAKTIAQQPISNPLQALQNRVPGIIVTQNTGVPGGNFTVQIRGQNSISNGNDPLYIIDGVIYPSIKLSAATSNGITANGVSPLSMINPNDIESIEILKDADATAIYGSRGANGVILITTKKASGDATSIAAGISKGINQVANRLNYFETPKYLEMRAEAFKNDGATPSPTDYDVNGTWDQNKYTDWQKELIGHIGNTTTAFATVSGNGKNSNYLIGGNFYDEGLVYPGDFGFNRWGVNSSIGLGKVNQRLNATFTINYGRTESKLPNSDPTANINLAPNIPDSYDQYGNLDWGNNTVYLNPMASMLRNIKAGTENLIGNVNINYRIFRNFSFKVSAGYNKITRKELRKLPLASNAPIFNLTAANREANFADIDNNSWILEPQLTYFSQIGPGKLDVLAGLSFQENKTEYRNIKTTGYSSDELMDNISSATTSVIGENTLTQYRYTAFFGRLNYGINNKYYLNLTARRDGSSRFGPGKQFANFGAVGAAWIFSDESIIKETLPFLSFGKLRASYGITGNDQIVDYGYLQLWSIGSTYLNLSTISPTRISNANYAWETNKKAEASLQFAFFRDKINFGVSYYRNRSSNQLVGMPLPPSTGSNSIQANLPAIVQNTGWEIESNFKIVNKKDWNWTAGINLTIPKNTLIAYPNLERSTNSTKYIIGQPLSILRYYDTSVDTKTGLFVFKDFDASGTRNDKDKYLQSFIGQSYYGGFQNTFRYKNLDLNILISFNKQTGLNYLSGVTFSPGYFNANTPQTNVPSEVLERWQNPDDVANIQKFTRLNNSLFSTARVDGGIAISDASFLRLKNIALNYSLPSHWLNKLKIKDIQLSIQGQNIITITKYIGLDPETQSQINLPPLRTFSLGLKLTI